MLNSDLLISHADFSSAVHSITFREVDSKPVKERELVPEYRCYNSKFKTNVRILSGGKVVPKFILS